MVIRWKIYTKLRTVMFGDPVKGKKCIKIMNT